MQIYPVNQANLDFYSKCVLTAIALLLAIVALRPVAHPPAALAAAANNSSYLYVEPGTTALRKPDGTQQVEGKVMIDMRNGDIWGFPTLGSVPYPVNVTQTQPQVSAPMYLGKFDFAKMTPPAP